MTPTLTLVAGPNGSGKSTISAALAVETNIVVDPDAIARTIDSGHPSRAAIPAARKAILLCRSLLTTRASFIMETTLAGHGAISLLGDAKRAGYHLVVIYVALGDPERSLQGARERIRQRDSPPKQERHSQYQATRLVGILMPPFGQQVVGDARTPS